MPEPLKSPLKEATYDLETLSNLITACFYSHHSKAKKQFVLYDDLTQFKDLLRFLAYLKKNRFVLVGINTVNFDNQLLQFIMDGGEGWVQAGYSMEEIVRFIYDRAQYIINLDEAVKWLELIPEHKFTIPTIDLFKQKHYDGKAKQGTSLKWLQFTMRYPNIEEMPIHHATRVTREQIPHVLSYNWNDVDSTAAFFERNRFETDLRLTLSAQYKLRLLNASEPRLAKQIFAKFLCDEMGIEYGELKNMRTFRKEVALKNVVLPYIRFESPELKAVLKRIQETTVDPNAKSKFDLTFHYGGIETVVGLGGIHACCQPGVYAASENLIMEDIDVVSFYPNLAIENNLRPAHLGPVFNKVYKFIFDERVKIPKSNPINYVYKIILNSTYGLSKEINSYLYDPFFTYSITINGQLSILMLVESLVRRVPGLKIYQENTDGVTIGYAPEHKPLVAAICDEWCKITKLKLEHALYEKMVIRDVNNYMAIKASYVNEKGELVPGFDWNDYQENYVKVGKRKKYDKIKHKGTFELELDYHKNPSFLIISMAAEAHFFGGVDFREFIRTHRDVYDFFGAVKKKSNFDLNWNLLEGRTHKKYPQQKVTRFYVSSDGGIMTKDFHDGRRVAVLADWLVTPQNTVSSDNATDYKNLNHTYYIKEAEKLITSVEGNANQLKLF